CAFLVSLPFFLQKKKEEKLLNWFLLYGIV
ncbi:MAG: hypothetical protein ACI8SE_001853, partial [Bacteroidia bacterium]